MKKIRVIHGPNLNLLGEREPETYGTLTLSEINDRLIAAGDAQGVEIIPFQSNIEGEIVTALQEARHDAAGVILNPGGYTHTSVAIRDAITALSIPVIEAHLSNIHAREEFRHTSLTAGVCRGLIAGLGWRSYLYALHEIIACIEENSP